MSFSLNQGIPVSPDTSLRRDIRFQVRDPGKVATYVIVTGPGSAPVNGKPFGFKMLSPRIIRDAPELAGKPGTADFNDDDIFQFRATPTGISQVPEPTIADCVGSGVQGET